MSGGSGHKGAGTAGFTALFIRRPIFALVVNTLIIVAGLAALNGIEIRELPQVDQPVVSVNTQFDGASPETVDRELTSVIEGAVSRVQGIKDISSTSQYAQSRVTLQFSDTTDIGQASNDIRDALGRVSNQLPEDADEPRIVKADADSQPIMRLALTSDTLSMEDLTLLAENEITDRLAAVEGVADVQINGDQEKIFRIDINQSKLASRGLTVANLRTSLATASLDVPAGSLTSVNQDISVRATADLQTPEQFENLLLGDNVRLGDIATVTLGPDIGTSSLRSDGRQGIGLGIIRQAQSNTLDISEGVKTAVTTIAEILPKGTQLKVTSDDAVFIEGAIHEVEIALIASVIIVTLVIYMFPARLAGNAHSDADHADRADRHLCGDLHGRLFHQYFDASRHRSGNGTGGGRCDRGPGKHRAAARRGHGAARCCSARYARSVLRRHRDDRDACRCLCALVLPAGADRRLVPRVRLRAGLCHSAFRLRLFDAVSDAGLAHAEAACGKPWPYRLHGPDRCVCGGLLPAHAGRLPQFTADRLYGRHHGDGCRGRGVHAAQIGADADGGPVAHHGAYPGAAGRVAGIYPGADAPGRGWPEAAGR